MGLLIPSDLPPAFDPAVSLLAFMMYTADFVDYMAATVENFGSDCR